MFSKIKKTIQAVQLFFLMRKFKSLKQSDSRSRRKKGAKTQPQGLREKTIWKRVST